jgi:hypothetical protein
MSSAAPAISREAALRISLASRVLPDIGPRELLTVLIDKLGAPLTEDKHNHTPVTKL